MSIKSRSYWDREYFVFLLPVFFVLHGFSELYPLVAASDCLVLLVQYLLGSVLLSLVFYFYFRSGKKTALFVFLVFCFYFFFGSVHDTLKSFFGEGLFTKYVFILPFSLIVFIVLALFLKRSTKPFHRLTIYLNILLLVLILIDTVQLSFKLSAGTRSGGMPAGFVHCDSCSRPDIYFIVADEYAGNRELREVFHYDNSFFENALEQRGFQLIDSSVSNYNYTPFSIASILSMNYLKGIEGRNKSKTDRRICYDLINRNPVFDFLTAEGYEIRNLSVFQCQDQLPPAPSSFFLTGKDLLTAQTFFSRLRRDIGFNLLTRFHLQSEIRSFAESELSKVQYLYNKTKVEAADQQVTRPRFIYTHLMMPHYPYFFDSSGKKNPPEIALEGSQYRQKEYIGYLKYANGRFVELIDFIQTHSKRPPIIIFMGDHGFRHFVQDVDHKYYFMNLNAVYLPEKSRGQWYKGLSSVNEFRVIFNASFHQHLQLLRDSTSFLTE